MGEENKLPYTYFDAQGNEVVVDSEGNESILEFANDEDAAESTNETSNTEPSFKSYNAYQRAQERKANQEERRAKLNQFGENFAKWWEAYNGVSTPTVADTTETPSQPNVGGGVTTNGAQTTGVGGTTTTNTTDTGDKSFEEKRMDIHTSLQRNHAEALKSYNEAVKNGHSAYETLVRNALQKKANIAERKERDARSRALTNALGTLVGAFTAHGMAKKGGYAPIVNAHDSGVDNDFRKSVEQRYALENENEGLLLQLAQERKKYEADLAKSAYERDVKNAEAIADIYNKSIDAAEKAHYKAQEREWEKADKKEGEKVKFDNQKAMADYKAKLEKEALKLKDDYNKGLINYRNEKDMENYKKKSAIIAERIRLAKETEKKEAKDPDEYWAFVTSVNNGYMIEKANSEGDLVNVPYPLTEGDVGLLNSTLTMLKDANLTKSQMTEARRLIRDAWINNHSNFVDNYDTITKEIIEKARKTKNMWEKVSKSWKQK